MAAKLRTFFDDPHVLDERGAAKIRLVFNYERDKLPALEKLEDSVILQELFNHLEVIGASPPHKPI